METLTSDQQIEQALTKYDVATATIAEAAEKAEALTIKGLGDDVGYALVKTARGEARKMRTRTEDTRQILKRDAIDFSKAVDAEAKRIKALIQPIEDGLQAKLDVIEEERGRLERERLAREAAFLKERIDALRGYGVTVTHAEEGLIGTLGPAEYAEKLAAAKASHEAEERRKAKEAAELERTRKGQQAEREALDKERDELEAERLRLDKERTRLIVEEGVSPDELVKSLPAPPVVGEEISLKPVSANPDAMSTPRRIVPVRVADAQEALNAADAAFDSYEALAILKEFVERIAKAG